MYWVAAIILAGFLVLLCLARKEDAAQAPSSLLKPFYRMAMYIYKKSCRRVPRLFSSLRVEKDLMQLHPGESRECLKTEYYVKKAAVCLAVILLGTLFGVAARFSMEGKVLLKEDGTIARGSYLDGEKVISVETEYGQQKMDFEIEVEPKLLSEEEAEKLFAELWEKLPEYILGKNDSLKNVTSDLALKERYGEFPMTVRWESSRPGVLNDGGQLFPVEAAETVTLSVYLTYGGLEREERLEVQVAPPALNPEEQLYMELEGLLQQSQSESLEQDEWILPSEWQGEGMVWRQVVEDNSLLLWAAAMVTAVLVFVFLDKDLHEQLERRKKSLRGEYSQIVHKLALFGGAGMTVRGAFQKTAGDYERKLQSGGRRSPAYEEMVYTCRELRSGISEGLSYEHFGKRTGLQEYIRLSALLTQNLKRGNSMLLERLREEADKSAEERLQQSKKLGEEAGTKLLVPMVLMLAVVMAIIMVPAFSNM